MSSCGGIGQLPRRPFHRYWNKAPGLPDTTLDIAAGRMLDVQSEEARVIRAVRARHRRISGISFGSVQAEMNVQSVPCEISQVNPGRRRIAAERSSSIWQDIPREPLIWNYSRRVEHPKVIWTQYALQTQCMKACRRELKQVNSERLASDPSTRPLSMSSM